MNKLTITACVALLSTSAAVGLAGEYTPPAPTGLGNYAYVGLEGGAARFFAGHGLYHDWRISGKALGGYLWKAANQFYAGLELGFAVTRPQYSNTNLEINVYDIDLLGVAKYDFTENFNIFAKVGGAYLSTSKSDIDNTFRVKASLGLGYDFNNNWGITLSYSRIFVTGFDDEEIDNVHLGVIYRFV